MISNRSIARSVQPMSLARMLWKRKAGVLIVAVALGAAGLTGLHFYPKTYRAETLILVEAARIPERLVSSTVNVDLQDRLATIQQQVMSTTRLQRIIQKHALYGADRQAGTPEEIIERMRTDIQIKPEKGWSRNRPGAIRVSYQGHSPETVAAVAGELGNLFIEENLKAREVQASGTADFLGGQLEDVRKKLTEQEAKITAFKQLHAGELPTQETALATAVQRMHTDLQAKQEAVVRGRQNQVMLETNRQNAELALANLRRLVAEGQAAREERLRAVPTPAAEPPRVVAPAPPSRSETLAIQVAEMRKRYSEKHPQVRALMQELEASRAAEARTPVPAASTATGSSAAAPAPKAEAAIAPPASDLRISAEITDLENRINTIRTQIDITAKEVELREGEVRQLGQQISGAQARIDRLPVREQELLSLTRDYESVKAQYKNLSDKNTTADMATEMERQQQSERFAVLELARVPENAVKPNKIALAPVICVFALIISIAAAFVRELHANVVLGEWELPKGIDVIGRIPHIS